MITGSLVLNTARMPARISRPSLANSGPRWSMVGWPIAASTLSGELVGPGIWRKWRPVSRDMGGLAAGGALSRRPGRDREQTGVGIVPQRAAGVIIEGGADRARLEAIVVRLARQLRLDVLDRAGAHR